MVENHNVQLEFKAKELNLKFANEEEFFETLGIRRRFMTSSSFLS